MEVTGLKSSKPDHMMLKEGHVIITLHSHMIKLARIIINQGMSTIININIKEAKGILRISTNMLKIMLVLLIRKLKGNNKAKVSNLRANFQKRVRILMLVDNNLSLVASKE